MWMSWQKKMMNDDSLHLGLESHPVFCCVVGRLGVAVRACLVVEGWEDPKLRQDDRLRRRRHIREAREDQSVAPVQMRSLEEKVLVCPSSPCDLSLFLFFLLLFLSVPAGLAIFGVLRLRFISTVFRSSSLRMVSHSSNRHSLLHYGS